MLCSAQELGLGDDNSGLLELPSSTVTGCEIVKLFAAEDAIVELNVTPNRGDCLSVLGIGREVAAYQRLPAVHPRIKCINPADDRRISVHLASGRNCTRYAGRIIQNVDLRQKTPLWMRERLRRSGIRAINVVVDITNYVMLELGQPMHAFDCGKLSGAITVRSARAGESLRLLDGSVAELHAETTVIADEAGPLAVAGVMGGLDSGVTQDTRAIFLESAWFDPVAVGRCARRMNLHTDAAHRFERGVDPAHQVRAIERATALVLEFCGGRAGPVSEARLDADTDVQRAISFSLASANALLGTAIDSEEARTIFLSLDIGIAESSSVWRLTPPTHRPDLQREIDLVEELARLHGYSKIPCRLPAPGNPPASDETPLARRDRVREQLVAMGYFEAITYSFVAREPWAHFAAATLEPLELANPISRDMAVMRSSLWPGLLAVIRHNQSRQIMSLRVFESGTVFPSRRGGLQQYNCVAGAITGAVWPDQWGAATRPVDFYDVKQDLLNVFDNLGLDSIEFQAAECPGLHPGLCASISRRGEPLGVLGLLHPRQSKALNIGGNTFLFEILVEDLGPRVVAGYRPFSRYPQVRRDLAVVVHEGVTADTVLDVVRKSGGEFLRDLQLFDVYRGQGIDSDKKSLALGLIFQAPSSTLTDTQVEAAVRGIVDRIMRDLNGSLRV
jgi:phenylalanyl-tRNA synthetase beta chain